MLNNTPLRLEAIHTFRGDASGYEGTIFSVVEQLTNDEQSPLVNQFWEALGRSLEDDPRIGRRFRFTVEELPD